MSVRRSKIKIKKFLSQRHITWETWLSIQSWHTIVAGEIEFNVFFNLNSIYIVKLHPFIAKR
ncbi:hypothetical protein AGR4A_Cc80323 [Agrobacterium tumefaciens str. B6]|uniref:Uncharacterized protein n=2 Tax=Agrobacterium tumefaciens TaxID=358 RepID=A0A822UZU0_AGRTU|nr:hypothetical protein AGR4B_Cc60985 [Agrobacterium tumefaciens str. CFBP 5621]CUX37446.1 hypothetical protein AGR4C_Cc80130 [Agrobacterium tumefaciens str. Kerr 14]CVI20100.1 hypothetical protein AGR4A_Cc80323 [Agrobacterium tumefaciens str. B6]